MVSLFAGGVGATGPGAILGHLECQTFFSKKVAKIVGFYSIFETDPAFYLDENAARALKCVRGRKNERGLPRSTFTPPLNRQDPLSASTVWGMIGQSIACTLGARPSDRPTVLLDGQIKIWLHFAYLLGRGWCIDFRWLFGSLETFIF